MCHPNSMLLCAGIFGAELRTVQVTSLNKHESAGTMSNSSAPTWQATFSDAQLLKGSQDQQYSVQNLTWAPHGECLAFCGHASSKTEIVLVSPVALLLACQTCLSLQQPPPVVRTRHHFRTTRCGNCKSLS